MTSPSSQSIDRGNNLLPGLAPQDFTCSFMTSNSENKEYCLQLFLFAEKQNISWNGLHLSLQEFLPYQKVILYEKLSGEFPAALTAGLPP